MVGQTSWRHAGFFRHVFSARYLTIRPPVDNFGTALLRIPTVSATTSSGGEQMSGIRVTPEQLAAMSGRVSSGATSIEGELQSLAGALAPLGSDWAGVAEQRFEALWPAWQRSARGLHEAPTGVTQL